jgi:hypothetical protein
MQFVLMITTKQERHPIGLLRAPRERFVPTCVRCRRGSTQPTFRTLPITGATALIASTGGD